MTSFSSPREYLEYLQDMYARSYSSGPPDEEFAKLTDAQLKEHDLSIAQLGQSGGLERAIEALKADLLGSFEVEDLQRINADIAIGVVRDGEANAYIARSPNGKYALVMCYGLMLLLHKYLKLVRAFVAPGDVVHCNRKPAAALTKDDLAAYISDLVHIYLKYKAPYGPMVKLSDRAAQEHSFLLGLAERFIVCHELGHYFNGDLSDESGYSLLPHGAQGQMFNENQDHEVEYRADVRGFGFYRRWLERRGLDPLSLELLKPLLATFNLLYALGGGASSTHPHPYDRVVRIVTHWYGNDVGGRIAEALAEPSLLPSFFASRRT